MSSVKKRIQKINLRFLSVLAIFGVLVWFAEPGLPKTKSGWDYLPFLISGLALVAVGEIVRIWATGHLEKNKSLTTSGPYAYIKNPMYAGTFIIMLGCNILAINPYIYYILAVELAAFLFQYVPAKNRIEKTRLLEKFGQDYADYDKNVPDYIPRRLTPYEKRTLKPWQWSVFRGNQEIQVGIAVLIGTALIVGRLWIS
ncbi:MAG: isoprenylcysteine carboxylmethyltransferase family protein [Planctomycetota bacterium]